MNNNLELPLLNKINNEIDGNIFNDHKIFDLRYIEQNLKHNLRPYQKKALFGLDYAMSNTTNNSNQFMFNMATGSGKTDIIAATILYLYRNYGYCDFIFVSNTNAVVKKTFSNLIDVYSNKYLFKQSIDIDGKNININLVDNFQEKNNDNEIRIKIATIQSLDSEYRIPQQGKFYNGDLENKKIGLLIDEAHHFNAETASNNKKKKVISWENTLNEIRNKSQKNIQLEFTATLDLSNDKIYTKYKNKIISRYPLSSFIKDKYAKKVFKLESNNNDNSEMINAVLISEFRKKVALRNNIVDFKPVILFKSKTIKESNAFNEKFSYIISNLNKDKLKSFISKNKDNKDSELMYDAYNLLYKENMNNLLHEIKRDFNNKNIINVNKDDIGDDINFDKINSLESVENPIRAIFAVAKLNEGWDVLNLFDIVRLGNSKSTLNSTNQEAQLVGRGARYYPLSNGKRKTNKRIFDEKEESNIKYLERLYYHTSNDSEYLKNLQKSFVNNDLPVNYDNYYQSFHAKVKTSFKKTSTYLNGKIYQNKVRKTNDEDFNSIKSYGIDVNKSFKVNNLITESYYNKNDENNKNYKNISIKTIIQDPKKDSLSKRLLKKGMSRNQFYRFSSLHSKVPSIKSIEEFIISPNWLGNTNIKLYVNGKDVITINDKLHYVDLFLEEVKQNIIKNYRSRIGTNEFYGIPIKDVVKNYEKNISKKFSDIKLNVQENIQEINMKNNIYYVYDNAIVDGLESELITKVTDMIKESNIFKDFNNIYIIRNEETNINGIKIHDFGKTINSFKGYMPDFILLADIQNIEFQIYIEPKGPQLLSVDKWKEDILTNKIKPNNIKLIGEDKDIRLYGIPFYTNIRNECSDCHNAIESLKNIFK